MYRRDLLLAATGLITARAVRAQQKAMPVIGFLGPGSQFGWRPFTATFRQGLSETGYVEGHNLTVEYRWAENNYERLPSLAADLVSHKVDLIVTGGGTTAALAAKNATSTIPIVFTEVGDPVGSGLVVSLARPGGNLTGFGDLNLELMPKRLELLCELIPQAAQIALLVNPDSATGAAQVIKSTQGAALVKGLQLTVLEASSEGEIEAAFAQLHADVLLVHPEPFFGTRRDQFVTLAARHAVPAIYWNRGWVAAGGLISYGPDVDALFRQAGIYAGRILKGEKPADLPVQQPTTYKLVVNLKTAKALGLTVPSSILARADEVIE